jgi:hypothetical protein
VKALRIVAFGDPDRRPGGKPFRAAAVLLTGPKSRYAACRKDQLAVAVIGARPLTRSLPHRYSTLKTGQAPFIIGGDCSPS